MLETGNSACFDRGICLKESKKQALKAGDHRWEENKTF